MLLINRRDAVRAGAGGFIWNRGMKGFEYVFSKRSRLDFVDGKTKNIFALFGSNALGKNKQIPKLANQSFSKQWNKK